MRYRKKPVVIDAFQLNERGLVGEDWFWDAVSRNDIITHHFGKYHPEPAWCEIKTLEGIMVAKAGDYIIRGVHGELYPCKPDIFKKTYEEVEAIEHLKSTSWIPVSERLPEEYDSIFAKFKGTDNWKRGMFEKTSKYVIATVVFDDGAVLVEQAHTTDGIWRTDNEVFGGTVVAWMDYPEPYRED